MTKIVNKQADEDYRLLWISENLKIINKSGQLVNLYPNIGQLMLHNSIGEQRRRGLPVRINLLKPRQVGWTTWSEAEGFFDVYHKPNWNAMAVSMDIDSTDVVFRMSRLFHQEMPQPRPADNTNRKELIFSPPHRSRFVAQTAGKVGVGRSDRIQYLHMSEFAFWANAKEQAAGLYQVVPNIEGTVIIKETTANGVGGAFYDDFWEAVKRRRKHPDDYSGYLSVFFPWWKFPEYSIPGPFEPDPEEKELAKEFGLTNGQLKYRRLKIQELNGDIALFNQEYPDTAMAAFQASGSPVFTQRMLDYQGARCKEPRYCVFTRSGIEDVERRFNCWQVVNLPVEGHQYTMGIDTMEGRLSDTNDPKSTQDCDAVAILDRDDNAIVAIYHGRTNQTDLGEQCLWAAIKYNDAWVAPELPHSMEVLRAFKSVGYQNIYNRQVHDEHIDAHDSENLGWRTTLVTRKWLVDSLTGLLRSNGILVNFHSIVDEMRTFIKDKTGKPIHMRGEHDDILFAVMIAIQVHLRCPLHPAAYSFTHTGEDVDYSGGDKGVNRFAKSGVVDDEFDEEEEWDY